jgi:hypothetical protein
MKKVAGALLYLFCASTVAFGQWSGYESTAGSELDGGFGMTWIDNQAYYGISFQPDIGIGKFGVGLNINLMFNVKTGKFYSQEWKTKYDYARMIRYLRYGRKGDPVYTRVGALDAERLGHGFILNFYNNQIVYAKRKIGMTLDIDFGPAGFESLTNNLGRTEVFGARGYVRPLHSTEIPVLKNLAFGASYVTDLDPDSWKASENDDVAEYGADVELPIIKSSMFTTMLYADYAKLRAHDPLSGDPSKVMGGSGQTIGVRTDVNTLWGFLALTASFERRYLGENFIASYFGPFYEILRHTTIREIVDFYESIGGDPVIGQDYLNLLGPVPVSQSMLLSMMTEERKAWYGALDLDFFHLVRVVGSYQKVDGTGKSGMLHFGAGLSQNIPLVAAEATYDKRGIGTFEDIRTLDYRSVARVGVGYKMKPYLLLYLDYIWTFVWDEGRQLYKPQERFQPRVALRLPIQYGN